MSYIGALEFIQMAGPQIPSLASYIQPLDRAGTNGTGFRSNALKSPEVEKRTVQWVTSLAAAQAAADTYALLKGQLVTVIEDCGRTVDDVMVLDCRALAITALLNPVPAGYTHMIEGIWALKPTA